MGVAVYVVTIAVSIVGAVIIYLGDRLHERFNSLYSTELVLSTSPTDLKVADILALYMRALQKAMPMAILGGARLPRPNEKGTGFNLPKITIEAPFELNDAIISSYLKAVNGVLPQSDRTGPTLKPDEPLPALLLAAATTPLFVMLICHQEFPIAAMGSVNTKNTFEMLRPDICATLAEVRKRQGWKVSARVGGEAPRRKRGVEWDMYCDVVCDGEDGQPITVFRQTFSALKFLPKSHPPKYDPANDPKVPEIPADAYKTSKLVFKVPQSAVDSWAHASRDYQPIHVVPFLAKYAFGLPGSIAHGNLLAAAVSHALQRGIVAAGPAGSLLSSAKGGWKFQVAFKRIMPVGKSFEVDTGSEGSTGLARLARQSGGERKPNLEASIVAL